MLGTGKWSCRQCVPTARFLQAHCSSVRELLSVMERFRISHLQPGQRLSQPLFSATGQKLLNAGVVLNDRHLQALRRCGDGEVFSATSMEELVEAGVVQRYDSSRLTVGQRSDRGVMTAAGQIVLEPGQEVEEHHMDALAADGNAYVTSKATAAAERRERVLMADALVEDLLLEVEQMDLRVNTSGDTSWVMPYDPATWPSPEKLKDIRQEAVTQLRHCYARVEAGLAVDINDLDHIVVELLDRLAHYPSQFTQLALLCPRREDYLPDHAYTVTVLAMAIGQQLGWSKEAVHQQGIAGLTFDMGMLMVPERIRTGACELTDIDRSRVQRHPVFTLALMQTIDSLDPIIQLAALQHHERENGSGYPRGSRKDKTCDYARVLAVADTFAASTEPRHWRKPKLPYVAMEETLRLASAMVLWKPAVRALIQAAGLFPVGSYVKLSDGSNAHVLASNPQQLARPLVQPLEIDGSPKGPAIDLSQWPEATLTITRPIATFLG